LTEKLRSTGLSHKKHSITKTWLNNMHFKNDETLEAQIIRHGNQLQITGATLDSEDNCHMI